MISLFSGTPGSGKSLHVASRIWFKLRAGKPCICNFDMNRQLLSPLRGQFVYKPNDELKPDFLRQYASDYWQHHRFHEDTILLVIDEAQLVFNAREWQAAGRADWLSFFTQHRKFGYEVVLVAQFDRMLDRQIRSLLEYEYIHRKVSNFGIYGKLLALWTLNKLFIAVKVWYPLKEKVGAEWFICRKKFYRLYDSYARLDETNSNQNEGAADLIAV